MENHLFDQIGQIIFDYKKFIVWLGTISFLFFIFSLISIKWLVALIPSDYFVNKKRSRYQSKYPLIWLISIIIKNIIGYVLIVGGILMLVLPGQGLFTIFIGLMLSNYPGKFFIEKNTESTKALFLYSLREYVTHPHGSRERVLDASCLAQHPMYPCKFALLLSSLGLAAV